MMPVTDRIRLLIIQANPLGTDRLDSDIEQRKLDAALMAALERNNFAPPIRLSAARIADLPRSLRYHQPHILHFIGHGDGAGGLLLNATDDQERSILSAADLADLIGVYQAEATIPLQLILLAGCDTALAAQLLSTHVACAIGTTDALLDVAVRDVLTPAFYGALGDGRSVGNALDAARAELRSQGYVDDAAMVQAYTRGEIDPTTLQPRAWLKPPGQMNVLSPLHLAYLRHWFGQPWTTISLADIKSDRQDQAQLLDLYVPLPVDFSLVIKTVDGKIVDWWAQGTEVVHVEDGTERTTATDGRIGEAPHRTRSWGGLGVDEAGLAQIVEGIQQKITTRGTAGTETKDGEHTWYMEAHDAASVQPRFVLLGDPGSGKSSFLRHLALCLAGEMRRRANDTGVPANASLSALRDWLLDTYTPLYLEMRTLVSTVFPALPSDATQPAALPTAQTLWAYLAQDATLARYAEELRLLIDQGALILLLDGLDETPLADDPRRRAQIKAFVTSLTQTYPELRIIIGSRPHAYRSAEWRLSGFGQAALQPLHLTRLQELALALFQTTGLPAPAQAATNFVQALRDHPHMDARMHANPLFFTLLAALWLADTTRRLPETEAELYRAAVDLLLDRWTRRRAPNPSVAEWLGLGPEALRPLLEVLACTVHGQGATESGTIKDSTIFPVETLLGILYRGNYRVIPQDISDYLTQHAGLLVSPTPAHFYFSHRSFQEHLAACELTCLAPTQRVPPVGADRQFPNGLLHRVLQQPQLWQNVALLASDELMRLGQADAVWALLDDLCRPYLEEENHAAAVPVALTIAQRHDLFALDRFDRRNRPIKYAYDALLDVAHRVLADDTHFTPEERNIAGELLGRNPEHDTRPGVGCANGLPAIDWVKIPEADEQGNREFIYQEDERCTEPTFWMARYPVTYGQFQAFLDAEDGFYNPLWWEGLAAPEDEKAKPREQAFKFWNHPRENLNWHDAIAFCRWLTAKAKAQPALLPPALRGRTDWRITLPTEWQWEKAARGPSTGSGTGRRYPWGEKYVSGYANIDETGRKDGPHYLQKTSAVGMYPPNKSPFGVVDMSGNVWEYCLNEYSNPDRTQETGNANRVVRGGSWSYSSSLASLLYRSYWLHSLQPWVSGSGCWFFRPCLDTQRSVALKSGLWNSDSE